MYGNCFKRGWTIMKHEHKLSDDWYIAKTDWTVDKIEKLECDWMVTER